MKLFLVMKFFFGNFLGGKVFFWDESLFFVLDVFFLVGWFLFGWKFFFCDVFLFWGWWNFLFVDDKTFFSELFSMFFFCGMFFFLGVKIFFWFFFLMKLFFCETFFWVINFFLMTFFGDENFFFVGMKLSFLMKLFLFWWNSFFLFWWNSFFFCWIFFDETFVLWNFFFLWTSFDEPLFFWNPFSKLFNEFSFFDVTLFFFRGEIPFFCFDEIVFFSLKWWISFSFVLMNFFFWNKFFF